MSGVRFKPNMTWISRVLGTSTDTVRRAMRGVLDRGLATQTGDGRLVFEDPARWPEILGISVPDDRRLALVSSIAHPVPVTGTAPALVVVQPDPEPA